MLSQSDNDRGPTGWDGDYGCGRVNAAKAVESSSGVATDLPAAPSAMSWNVKKARPCGNVLIKRASEAEDHAGSSAPVKVKRQLVSNAAKARKPYGAVRPKPAQSSRRLAERQSRVRGLAAGSPV